MTARPEPGDVLIVAVDSGHGTHAVTIARQQLMKLLPGVTIELVAGLREHIIIRPPKETTE